MLKDTTKEAIRALDFETQQELVRFIAEVMQPRGFARSFYDKDDLDWTQMGMDIADEFGAEIERPPEPTIDEETAARLHEAICDGRRQDAIDILTEEAGVQFRSVREQANLFPERVKP